MGQEGIAAVENVGDGVPLVRPQGDLRVHAGKDDVASVVFAGPGAVHFLVVLLHQRRPPLRVLPYPVLESIPNKLLLLRRQGGFLGIEDPFLLAVRVGDGIIDAGIPEVQGVLQQPVGVGPVRAVGGVSGHVVVGNLSATPPCRGNS